MHLTRLPEDLFQRIGAYIDQNYIDSTDSFAAKACPMDVLLCESCAPAAAASLEELLEQQDAGFTETLLKRIDASGKKDAEVYKKAGLTRQHFSKIRNNPYYTPTKPTAIALALALELDLADTQDLIGRAGYALTASSKFDLIIQFFIEQKDYNLTEINMALYEFDQPLLSR